MKTILKPICSFAVVLLCFLYGNNLQAQRIEHNVPIIVKDAFQQKFPDKEPIWFSEYQGRFDQKLVYEARFMFDNRYSKAFYENEGKMLAFAAVIETKELPEKALRYMKENYPAFPIAQALLVTYASNEVQFEVGIYIDNAFMVQVFSKDGDFIKIGK
ncbi:hypothetical protein [Flavobacterium sp.]